MAHVLAGAFQQLLRIRKLGTTEEPHVDVGRERVDVGESRVRYACGRMTVVQDFSHIVSTRAHDGKPMPRESPQLTRMLLHPGIDGRIPPD